MAEDKKDSNSLSGGNINSVSIKVKIEKGNSPKKEYHFQSSFNIGRSADCSIQVDDGLVSRIHVEVSKENGSWWISDNKSSNGTIINGQKIGKVELKNDCSIELGKNGPVLTFTFAEAQPEVPPRKDTPVIEKDKIKGTKISQNEDPSLTKYIDHYFNEKNDANIGEHTKLMREAFKVVKKKQSSKYIKIIILVGIIAIGIGSYALYQNLKENKQKQFAEDIFYNMKVLELQIASLKDKLAGSKDPAIVDAMQKFDEKYQQLEKNYQKVVDDLDIYNLDEKDKLIIKTARTFGECEFAIPSGFMSEVKNYIKYWQSTSRYEKGLERASKNGYNQLIVNNLIKNKLPYQFFYLGLQESDYIEQRVGPQTRFGYAKGVWQFISETAKRYGLTIGPLAANSSYDPGDDRFNIPKATNAAARYIRDIYNTDAQASGLLVMASYNWGEQRVIDLIRKMPANPKDRNFWKLLEKYRDKLPDETYNYVFYIFSAAVIGENPRLFGFNFDNPLKTALANIN